MMLALNAEVEELSALQRALVGPATTSPLHTVALSTRAATLEHSCLIAEP